MELYKSRNFAAFFQDTFLFLKQNGKHFFKNYLTINGVFILILLAFIYFIMDIFRVAALNDLDNQNPDNFFENYINQNGIAFLLIFALFAIIAIFAAIVNYAYTPIYLILYEKHQGKNFGVKEIIWFLRAKAHKIFIFILSSILIAIPLLIGVGIVSFILAITIVGFVLIFLVIALTVMFYQFALIEYLQEDKGIFECFNYSIQLCFKKFWAAAGSVAIFYMMAQILMSLVTLIPYLFGIFSIVSNRELESPNTSQDIISPIFILLTILYMFVILLNIITNSILQVNQGVIFFGLKEEIENINTKSNIDQIGSID